MAEKQIKLSWFQKIRQIPSNIARKKQKKRFIQNYEFAKEKIINSKTSFHVREAYKTLRTNLIFSLPAEGCKKIVVTSALASEGKSTNCLNMAITFAEMDAKVLIIDCDLRRPNLAKLLDVSNTPGLTNYLVGLNTCEDVIRKSEYNNLSYITAGNIPPNPVELLGSEKMDKLVAQLEQEFDYIFFDTPPVNLVVDTIVVSKYVHGVVMIALHNSTDKESMRYALNQLDFVGAKILGFILNGVVISNKGKYKNTNKKNYNYYRKNKKGINGGSSYSAYKYGYYYEYGSYDGYSQNK